MRAKLSKPAGTRRQIGRQHDHSLFTRYTKLSRLKRFSKGLQLSQHTCGRSCLPLRQVRRRWRSWCFAPLRPQKTLCCCRSSSPGRQSSKLRCAVARVPLIPALRFRSLQQAGQVGSNVPPSAPGGTQRLPNFPEPCAFPVCPLQLSSCQWARPGVVLC